MPQQFTVLLNGVVYTITLLWCGVADLGGWFMNIGDADNNPIIEGIALTTGCDMLEQYQHLGIGVAIFLQTDHDPDAEATFTNLGSAAHLYFCVNS